MNYLIECFQMRIIVGWTEFRKWTWIIITVVARNQNHISWISWTHLKKNSKWIKKKTAIGSNDYGHEDFRREYSHKSHDHIRETVKFDIAKRRKFTVAFEIIGHFQKKIRLPAQRLFKNEDASVQLLREIPTAFYWTLLFLSFSFFVTKNRSNDWQLLGKSLFFLS